MCYYYYLFPALVFRAKSETTSERITREHIRARVIARTTVSRELFGGEQTRVFFFLFSSRSNLQITGARRCATFR